MRLPALSIIVTIALFTGTTSAAQEFEVPKDYSLKTEADYAKYEKDIVKCIDWIESLPMSDDSEKKKQASAFFIEWLTGAPNVSVELNSKTATFLQSSPDMLFIFMGGWTKFVIENPSFQKDNVKGNLAGLRSVIRIYKKDKGVKRDENIDKLVTLEDKGELEKWVAEQLQSK